MAELNTSGAPMSFELVSSGDDSAVVKVAGELDITTIDDLEEAVQPILKRDPQRLVIDVSSLRFADSSAIALWVRWATIVPGLEIHDPQPLLRRVIDSMGLAETLRVTP
ncbi:MAG: STAS domain-containing protein [Solirubrobacteraceae bacterium]